MSPFKFPCPNCGQRLAVFEDQIGTSEPCPSCGVMVTVPSPPPAPKDAGTETPAAAKTESKGSETKREEAPLIAEPVTLTPADIIKDPEIVDAKKPATDAAPAPKEGLEPSRKSPVDSKDSKPSDRSTISERSPISDARPPGILSDTPDRADSLHRVLERILASRFLTISILIHAFVVLSLGGTVLYHVMPEAPDFEASGGGLVEASDQAQPPEASAPSQSAMQELAPQAPTITTPVTASITTVQLTPNWSVAVTPDVPRGLSDSMKGALAAMDNRRGAAGAASAGFGSTGGTRSAMIFGKRIMAGRLGVILDVSGSAHPHLAGAVDEIQKGFSDAILILYPGCGMKEYEGNPEHQIRKFSSIPPKEIDPNADYFTTASQISSALKINEFAQMTKRTSVKETLFVSWYAPKSNGSSEKLIMRTQFVFEDLIKRGVDTIYWFSDFQDAVDPRIAERIGADLKSRRIKLHLHNFAGGDIDPVVRELAEKSGGTISVTKSDN